MKMPVYIRKLLATLAQYYAALQAFLGQKKWRWLGPVLLAIPIVIYNIGLLASGDKIIPGDSDYCFQLYEAFRRSVLEYGQFPLWNPWLSGGVPLFAHVVFGVVSIQTPFVLLFGSVVGTKLAIMVFELIAFFGFRALFKNGFGTAPVRATLLAYIPTFGSFFAYRIISGHFPFLLIAFTPWLLLLYLKRTEYRRGWIYFALVYSFMVWSSPHYITIMSLVVVGIWFVYESLYKYIVAARGNKKLDVFWQKLKLDGLFFLKAGALIVILSAYRMYFVLNFMKDYPRLEVGNKEPFTGIFTGLWAIWGPDQYGNPPQLPSGWSWAEASTYIGIGTLLCLLLVLYAQFKARKAKQKSLFGYPILVFSILFATFFIIGMGDFGSFSPYHLLSQLPVFSSMRVATRWLMWCSLICLCILAAYKGKRFNTIINIILVLTVAELFITNMRVIGNAFFVPVNQHRSSHEAFDQEVHYRAPRPEFAGNAAFYKAYPYDENLLEATRNNVGQIIAGDAFVDTRQPGSTQHCGVSQGDCPFITDNAVIKYWSPNKIVLRREGPGPIQINMNPGKWWLINGKMAFANYKETDPKKPFVTYEPARDITIEYVPRFSPPWILHKLGAR